MFLKNNLSVKQLIFILSNTNEIYVHTVRTWKRPHPCHHRKPAFRQEEQLKSRSPGTVNLAMFIKTNVSC